VKPNVPVLGHRAAAGPVLGVPAVQGTMLLPVVMSWNALDVETANV